MIGSVLKHYRNTRVISVLNCILTYTVNNGSGIIAYSTPKYRSAKRSCWTIRIFYIFVGADDVRASVDLRINDIDDNPPVITVIQRECSIPENTLDKEDFNCDYLIKDADQKGDVRLVQFSITPPEYEDIFEFIIDRTDITNTNREATAKLKLRKMLNFESVSVYSFTLHAKDNGDNTGNASVIIKVEDMNDLPPVWNQYFTTKSFDEKSEQSFAVYAEDGDTLKAEIGYEIANKDKCINTNIAANASGYGIINVGYIDRDTANLENDIMTCVLVAYENNSERFKTSITVSFVILDINDQEPVIEPKTYHTEIKETDTGYLDQIFTINDIDLGPNAQYNVKLLSPKGANANCHEAFQIIPTSGYQEWDFKVSIIKPEVLDYENSPDCNNFNFIIQSDDSKNINENVVSIKVKNMNNKTPKFVGAPYVANINETIGANADIITVKAEDEDYGDSVTYSFSIDSVKELYTIDEKLGTIKTIQDNTFDYEKQTVVAIQIEVRDHFDDGTGNFHTVTTQLTINVLDVNDETPKITLPIATLEIEENKPKDSLVTNDIIARDPDGTADLKFSIDWNKTWASKQGRKVDQDLFENVFGITSVMGIGSAKASLTVLEDKKLDYEKFEVIYLSVKVEDKNQVVNAKSDTVTLTVSIIDLNDNSPIFTEDSINSVKRVNEMGEKDTLIATILAEDSDGPKYNNIQYSLKPLDPDVPENLVTIDAKKGELRIGGPEKIDADTPKRHQLNYEVTASDTENTKSIKIAIHITDINNKIPKLKTPLTTNIEIPEETKAKHLQTIYGIDDDRDSPNNNVTYYLNIVGNPKLRDLFYIDKNTGDVWVSENANLDRDDGDSKHEIFIILEDNNGRQGESNKNDDVSFIVIVTDINNKDPILQEANIPGLSENDPKNKIISEIHALDRDEPCNVNTEIDYTIKNITGPDGNLITDSIFTIETKTKNDKDCTHYGVLQTAEPLKGFYGEFTVAIRATDGGKGSRYNEKFYVIQIEPYNYKNPSIVEPKDGDTLILDKVQELNQPLMTIMSRPLPDFEADDNQDGKFKMLFLLTDPTDSKVFKLEHFPDINKAQLQITQDPVPNQPYFLNLKAYHNAKDGTAAKEVQIDFKVLFTSLDELPVFEEDEKELSFYENAEECKSIPVAKDHKCDTISVCQFKIYYYITRGNVEDNFGVNAVNEDNVELCVIKALDRENVDIHNLEITASNYATPPANAIPLKVTVKVEDVNDNPPVFGNEFYSGSLTATDKPGRVVITLDATDLDSLDEGKLTFKILEETMDVSDPSLENIKNSAFETKGTNNIYSKFQPVSEMKGYFTFDVLVEDSKPNDPEHQDIAQVKIFIISDDNRIVFEFMNNKQIVQDEKQYIEEVFTSQLKYQCTIDEIDNKIESSGQPIANETDVKAHFIDVEHSEAVEKSVITTKVTNIDTAQILRNRFRDRGLNFSDIPDTSSDQSKDMEYLLQTLLIVVSVVLGTLCIILFVAFIIRTRSLKNRLEAMTTNVFGSTKSDLNRIGSNAPGTNKHAIEANPVWNEDLKTVGQYDTVSQGSGGSDLIGIEDKPDFEYDNRRASINPVIQEEIRRKSINPLASAQTDIDPNDFKPSVNGNSKIF
ncbi:dachsous [Carabus blaptoides fortunei]